MANSSRIKTVIITQDTLIRQNPNLKTYYSQIDQARLAAAPLPPPLREFFYNYLFNPKKLTSYADFLAKIKAHEESENAFFKAPENRDSKLHRIEFFAYNQTTVHEILPERAQVDPDQPLRERLLANPGAVYAPTPPPSESETYLPLGYGVKLRDKSISYYLYPERITPEIARAITRLTRT